MNRSYAFQEFSTMTRRQIIITAEDYRQLKIVIASNVARCVYGSDRLDELQAELDRRRSYRRTRCEAML